MAVSDEIVAVPLGRGKSKEMKRLQKYNRLLLLVSLVFIALVVPVSSQMAGLPLPLDDYWDQLQQTQALVASLLNSPAEVSRSQLSAEADHWENITAVILPDGTQVPLDHSFLASQLRADPPDLNRLNEILTALLAVRQNWSQAEFTSQDIQTLTRILARPEFQWPPKQPSLIDIWLQRLWDAFTKFLMRLLPDTTAINIGGPLFNYILTGLVVFILAVILFHISRSLLADFVTERRMELEAETSDEDLTANTALKRAQALSGAGDYRAAVRYLYLSSLLLLEERRLLRYDRSRTNREYLHSLAHWPELAKILREVVDVFDRVWYGYQALDEATYAQYAARIAELNQQTKQ